MSTIEIVGIVVVGLGILLGLVIQVINLISKVMEPIMQSFERIKKTVDEFTEAIHSLTVAVERLLMGQEHLTNEVQFHHGRLTELEKKAHEIQLNCARRNGEHKTP